MLARGCKNSIKALCFLLDAPTFGVLTVLDSKGV